MSSNALKVKTQWNHYVRPFSAKTDNEINGLLRFCSETTQVAEELCGHKCYLAYGALLGHEREGKLISHDFDIDVAIDCGHCSRNEVAEICRNLILKFVENGYQVKAKSFGQFFVLTPEGAANIYKIEFFASWFEEDLYFLYFAVSGKKLQDSLTPLQKINLQGHEFYAPGNPEALLAATYGDDWRVPNPQFKYDMTGPRWRPFTTYFFSRNKQNWERFYSCESEAKALDSDLLSILSNSMVGGTCLDIGCGSGDYTLSLTEKCDHMTAVDFSETAIDIFNKKRSAKTSNKLDIQLINLHDVVQCESFSDTHTFDTILCTRTLEFLSEVAEQTLWRVISRTLAPGGTAIISIENDYLCYAGDSDLETHPHAPSGIDIYSRTISLQKLEQRAAQAGFEIKMSAQKAECAIVMNVKRTKSASVSNQKVYIAQSNRI